MLSNGTPLPPPVPSGKEGEARPFLKGLALIFLCFFLGAPPAEARSAKKERKAKKAKARIENPYAACSAALHHLSVMAMKRLPISRKMDMTAYLCTDAQYYQAFYFQGMDSYNRKEMEEALLYFHLARDIGGPMDETILYHLWKIYSYLGDPLEQRSLYSQMRDRFPDSDFLARMKRGTGEFSGRTGFLAMNTMSFASQPGIPRTTKAQSYLSISRPLRFGRHQLEAIGNLSGNMGLAGARDPSFSYEGSLGYSFRGFRADATVGRARVYRKGDDAGTAESPEAVMVEEKYMSASLQQDLALAGGFDLSLGASGLAYAGDYGHWGAFLGLNRRWGILDYDLAVGADWQEFKYGYCYVDPDGLLDPFCETGVLRRLGGEASAAAAWSGSRNRLLAKARVRQEADAEDRGPLDREASVIGQISTQLLRGWKVNQTLEAGRRFQGPSTDPFYRYSLSLMFRR